MIFFQIWHWHTHSFFILLFVNWTNLRFDNSSFSFFAWYLSANFSLTVNLMSCGFSSSDPNILIIFDAQQNTKFFLNFWNTQTFYLVVSSIFQISRYVCEFVFQLELNFLWFFFLFVIFNLPKNCGVAFKIPCQFSSPVGMICDAGKMNPYYSRKK